MPISSLLPRASLDEMFGKLRMMGSPFGITFAEIDVLPNSGMVLEASEFARDHNKFDEFHNEVFRYYFTRGQDIGQIDVILRIAEQVELDPNNLNDALIKRQYASALDQARLEAAKYGITAAPTFIIEEEYRIVGAQPLDVFRDTLRKY